MVALAFSISTMESIAFSFASLATISKRSDRSFITCRISVPE